MMRFILYTLFMVMISGAAMACTCVQPTTDMAKQSYDDADVVINATIINNSEGWNGAGALLKLKINDVFKGENLPSEIMANYNNNTAACGNNFNEGQDYNLGLYDTRSLILTDANTRGYGFRIMISCVQSQIQYHLNNIKKDK